MRVRVRVRDSWVCLLFASFPGLDRPSRLGWVWAVDRDGHWESLGEMIRYEPQSRDGLWEED